MNKFISKALSVVPLILIVLAPIWMQNSASAQCVGSQSKCSACAGLSTLGSSQDCTNGGNKVNSLIQTAVNIMSYIVGAAAIIMIIISGIKFITAGGEASNVASAKNTLIWALAGVFIVALAQVILHLTLNTAVNLK